MKKNKRQQLYELRKKEPMTAALLNFLIVGAGHFYLRQYGKGLLLFFACMFLWIVFLGWIVWFIAPFIGYFDTKKANKMIALEMDL